MPCQVTGTVPPTGCLPAFHMDDATATHLASPCMDRLPVLYYTPPLLLYISFTHMLCGALFADHNTANCARNRLRTAHYLYLSRTVLRRFTPRVYHLDDLVPHVLVSLPPLLIHLQCVYTHLHR